MSKIIIFGASGFARLISHYIQNNTQHQVAAFTVDDKYVLAKEYLGLPLVGFSRVQDEYPPDKFEMIVAVTFQGISNQFLMRDKCKEAKDKGYRLFSYISPYAFIAAGVNIGENCIIGTGVIIEPFTRIGNGVVIAQGCCISHDVTIGDWCFIAPRASISGGACIETNVFIGNNATARDHITIGKESVIGAGVVILKDVAERTILRASEPIIIPLKRSKIEI